jgi:hypothetical protein
MRLFFALCAAMFIALTAVAGAAPPSDAPNDPDLHAWFQSLKSPSGMSCCSEADCRYVVDRIGSTGYQAFFDNKWIDIPNEIVVRRDNPTGQAVLCATQDHSYLYCFVPGFES